MRQSGAHSLPTLIAIAQHTFQGTHVTNSHSLVWSPAHSPHLHSFIQIYNDYKVYANINQANIHPKPFLQKVNEQHYPSGAAGTVMYAKRTRACSITGSVFICVLCGRTETHSTLPRQHHLTVERWKNECSIRVMVSAVPISTISLALQKRTHRSFISIFISLHSTVVAVCSQCFRFNALEELKHKITNRCSSPDVLPLLLLMRTCPPSPHIHTH